MLRHRTRCTAAPLLNQHLLPTTLAQYLGERHVMQQMQYNTMLTGFAFVPRRLLDLYWSDHYTQGAGCSGYGG